MFKPPAKIAHVLAAKWTGRKLGTMLFFSFTADVMLLLGKIGEQSWTTITIALFAAFVAGNVVDKRQKTDSDSSYTAPAVEKALRIDDSFTGKAP